MYLAFDDRHLVSVGCRSMMCVTDCKQTVLVGSNMSKSGGVKKGVLKLDKEIFQIA